MPTVVPRPRPHPVKAVLASRRLTIAALAPQTGCNPHTLGRIINGYVRPWPVVRRRVAEALDLPEASLWREDA
ncbi:MAG: helix-turn-helix domain-containing protein [Acidimicrobiales bacterium]